MTRQIYSVSSLSSLQAYLLHFTTLKLMISPLNILRTTGIRGKSLIVEANCHSIQIHVCLGSLHSRDNQCGSVTPSDPFCVFSIRMSPRWHKMSLTSFPKKQPLAIYLTQPSTLRDCFSLYKVWDVSHDFPLQHLDTCSPFALEESCFS